VFIVGEYATLVGLDRYWVR